jgi:uridine kinase
LPREGLVVVDGGFLQRPEVSGEFAFVIFLDVTFEAAAARMATRDGTPADPDHRRMRRYPVAHRRYLADFGPRERADLVLDNNDVDNPVMIRQGSGA